MAISSIREGYTLVLPSDASVKPQTYFKLLEKYGKGLGMASLAKLAGSVIDLSTSNLKILEEGAPTRLVTCSVPQSTTAPIDPVITFSSADGSDLQPREGISLVIPAQYVSNHDGDLELRLYKDGSDWKGRSFSSTATIEAAITSKELVLGASSFGEGSDGIDPTTSGFYERFTAPRILKESVAFVGNTIFNEVENPIVAKYGNKAITSKELARAEFNMDSLQLEAFLMTGNVNSNDSLTTNSIDGVQRKVLSGMGYVPAMKAYSQEMPYTTNFTMDDFLALKTVHESVGVIASEADFMMGTGLETNIWKNNLEWIKEYSQGTTLYSDGQSGYNVNKITFGNMTYYMHKLASFSDPSRFGSSEYGFRDTGFIVPREKNTVDLDYGSKKDKVSLDSLTLGYANGGGEKLKNTTTIVPGNTTILNNGPIAANSWSGVKVDIQSEVIPIYTGLDKTILIEKS